MTKESSAELFALQFHQDDGHIFCTLDQVDAEVNISDGHWDCMHRMHNVLRIYLSLLSLD